MRRSMRSTALPEVPTARSNRSQFPGALDAIADFKPLVGLEEQEAPTYSDRAHINETTMFENTTKVRRLVEAMERKEVQKDET